ncbi:MAG: hypothetical protein ACHBN1_27855 [Heteroscytonema crispum UTEX LB 1556]
MTELELHQYLPQLPEEALQEFTEWCLLEQTKDAGFEFIPDSSKLENLALAEYIPALIGQFMEATRNSIPGGLAAVLAGKIADKHALPGLAMLVDFVSLYITYLIPGSEKNELPPDEKVTQLSQQQFEQLSQIAKKYNVEI